MFDQSSQELRSQHTLTLFEQMRQSSWFTQILVHIKALQTLQTLFNQECPLELMNQCRVLGIKEASLIVEVDNASWATQLRYRTRELIAALRKYQELVHLKKIVIRISRVAISSNAPQILSSSNPVSPETAQVFLRIADEIIDPTLKEALLRFAEGGRLE